MHFDTKGEGDGYRWLFMTAILTAGHPAFLGGPQREAHIRLCGEFRAAAVRLLPPPAYEIELAHAGIEVMVHPDDSEAWRRFDARKVDVARALERAAKTGEGAGLVPLWTNELGTAAEIEAMTHRVAH
jgi:hypothetical protein